MNEVNRVEGELNLSVLCTGRVCLTRGVVMGRNTEKKATDSWLRNGRRLAHGMGAGKDGSGALSWRLVLGGLGVPNGTYRTAPGPPLPSGHHHWTAGVKVARMQVEVLAGNSSHSRFQGSTLYPNKDVCTAQSPSTTIHATHHKAFEATPKLAPGNTMSPTLTDTLYTMGMPWNSAYPSARFMFSVQTSANPRNLVVQGGRKNLRRH